MVLDILFRANNLAAISPRLDIHIFQRSNKTIVNILFRLRTRMPISLYLLQETITISIGQITLIMLYRHICCD